MSAATKSLDTYLRNECWANVVVLVCSGEFTVHGEGMKHERRWRHLDVVRAV